MQPAVKAVIFDLDGLLIDSEPLWQQAEIEVFREVSIELTSELCLQTKGLRIDEVVQYWYQRYPWTSLSQQEIEKRIVTRVIELIETKGKPLPGVESAIAFVRSQNVKIALASSSAMIIIKAALKALDLADVFTVICSAETEAEGKPHPAVYLSTAKKLEVMPNQCLALEDSLNGVLAAKAAGMKCIAVPEQLTNITPQQAAKEQKLVNSADIVLNSLTELNQEVWQQLFIEH